MRCTLYAGTGFGIADSPIQARVVGLIAKADCTLIYVSPAFVNIVLQI